MTKAETIEQLAAAAPTAPALAKQNQADQAAKMDAMISLANRKFAIEQATKATAAGGYETKDILALAKQFHAFLTE